MYRNLFRQTGLCFSTVKMLKNGEFQAISSFREIPNAASALRCGGYDFFPVHIANLPFLLHPVQHLLDKKRRIGHAEPLAAVKKRHRRSLYCLCRLANGKDLFLLQLFSDNPPAFPRQHFRQLSLLLSAFQQSPRVNNRRANHK